MEIYLIPIKSALVAFPVMALLFTLPYMARQYKKFGSIPFWRSAVLYSFMLYLINMYFFVILPLPPVEEVADYTGPTMQLVPFQFVSDFIQKSNLNLADPGTYLGAFTDSSFFVVLFNILLFVPFGIYLRYYFKWSWRRTLLACFSVSLFFELTQLSGFYGVYSRPYRLFDVDDLMLNTLGGMTGYWMTPVVCHFLPTRDRIDEIAYKKGERVPLLRRAFAFGLDWVVLLFLNYGVTRVVPVGGIEFFLLTAVYFSILPYASGGYTFGKWFFHMKLVTGQGEKPSLGQYLIRCGLLYGFLLAAPLWLLTAIVVVAALPPVFMILLALLAVFGMGMWLLFLWESLAQFFGRKRDYFYGRISGTYNQNTISSGKEDSSENPSDSGITEEDNGNTIQHEEI